MIKIFISHSAKDSEVVKALIELLRAALPLKAEDIRCTSIDGYRLPGGAETNDHLKQEVRESKVFIGLITIHSLESAYVQFELGARWGAEGTLVPLLAAGMNPGQLTGPLSGFNALSCDNESQIYQLLKDLAKELKLSGGDPSSYNLKVGELLKVSEERVKLYAPLVMLNTTYVIGQMRHPPSGKVWSLVVLPVRIINESERTITPSFFNLNVPINGTNFLFGPTRIAPGTVFNGVAGDITFENPHENDLHANKGSILPGQALTGLLMFTNNEVSHTELKNSYMLLRDQGRIGVICTDIRGYQHNVLLIKEAPNVIGAADTLRMEINPSEPP